MKKRVVAALIAVVMLGGCSGLFGPDKEGWRSSQKEAFLKFLEEDPYLSLCDAHPLYEVAKKSQDSKLMSRLLFAYAENLANGCIDYEAFAKAQSRNKEKKIESDYEIYRQKVDRQTLINRLRAGESVREILKPLVPKNPQFDRLVQRYRTLSQDGNTSKALLQKIRLNIERAKIMKPEFGEDYALINIPEFKVRIVEHNKTVLKFNVVVGKRTMQTPIFSESMRYIEINPQWNVPDSIMRKSYIKKIMKDPTWVARKGMELHKNSYDLNSPQVKPESVDWSKYLDNEDTNRTKKPKKHRSENTYIPYKLVQVPSKRNDLGRVKFIFPNRFSVYMHDTQAKHLFKRKVRCYSHGCIRLGKPITLMEYITTHYTNKDLKTVKEWYASLKTKHLYLTKPLRVHTAYFTTFVDDDGKLLVFNDVYGYDRSQKLREARSYDTNTTKFE